MKRRWTVLAVVALTVLGVPVVFFCAEHVRGQWTMATWEREALAKGNKLTVAELRPPISKNADALAALLDAIRRLHDSQNVPQYGPQPLASLGRGKSVVSWLMPELSPFPEANFHADPAIWREAETGLERNAAALADLRAALAQPPVVLEGMYTALNEGAPYARDLRHAASWLSVAATQHLRAGDLDGALANIKALVALSVWQRTPRLVSSQLTAMGYAVQAMDATWAAMQIPGWSDEQLRQLQLLWERGGWFEDMIVALEMERNLGGEFFNRLQTGHFSQRELAKYFLGELRPPFVAAPGPANPLEAVLVTSPDAGRRFFVLEVGYPLWRFAWAEQCKLHYLRAYTGYLDGARLAARTGVWPASEFSDQWVNSFGSTNRYDRLRFFISHPLLATLGDALNTAARVDVQQRMVMTAVALKRHRLRHGCSAPTLAAMVPEFLPALPTDLFDSQPLRYRLGNGETYQLYSVGEDGLDDCGDPYGGEVRGGETKDLAWPIAAAPEDITQYRMRAWMRR